MLEIRIIRLETWLQGGFRDMSSRNELYPRNSHLCSVRPSTFHFSIFQLIADGRASWSVTKTVFTSYIFVNVFDFGGRRHRKSL